MSVSRLTKFSTWDFFNPLENKLTFINADEIPFITYPNRMPCYEANIYMTAQLHKGLSRKVKGGTIDNYAHCIIHLVNHCYKNQIRFSQLTDSSFTLFVHSLQGERKKSGQLARSNNRVRNIVSQCLSFLVFIQELHDLENFIGTGKHNTIRIIKKEYKISNEGSPYKEIVSYISHTAMPSKDPVKKRLPASENDMLKAWKYIGSLENKEICERDKILYQCMEFLGARVTEIDMITVRDIEDAIATGSTPYLKLSTLKRRDGDQTRNIPIPPGILSNIKRYIRIVRRKNIKRTIGNKNDHGYLFISTTTGKHLDTKTITHIVNKWKKGADIISEFHPHLFRHSFITNKLKEIVLKHKEINSADKFREYLLHTERFKMELQQWTGHTKPYSLDIYIHLVFKDLAGYSKTYNAVQLNDSVKVMHRSIEQLKKEIQLKKISATETLLIFEESLIAFEKHIQSSLKAIDIK
jgi:site-specific recombinase XerD